MVLAGIVTYNPDIPYLEKNLSSIINQVDFVLIVDNGSANHEDIGTLVLKYSEAGLVSNNQNLGVARALNQIGAYAEKHGFEWFLTLDQDCVSCRSMVRNLLAFSGGDNIGILHATEIPPDMDVETGTLTHKIKSVEKAITAGSLTRTAAWRLTGGFWDFLFIDEVDHEFCYRLKNAGYRVVEIGDAGLHHVVGQPVRYKLLWNRPMILNYSPTRLYYQARNMRIVCYLYHKPLKPAGNRFKELIGIILFGTDRVSGLRAKLRGILDYRSWKRKYASKGRAPENEPITMQELIPVLLNRYGTGS